jgi:hypothetical protein
MIENFALIIRLIFVFDLRPAAKKGKAVLFEPLFLTPKTNSRKLTRGDSLEIPVTVSRAKYGEIRFPSLSYQLLNESRRNGFISRCSKLHSFETCLALL